MLKFGELEVVVFILFFTKWKRMTRRKLTFFAVIFSYLYRVHVHLYAFHDQNNVKMPQQRDKSGLFRQTCSNVYHSEWMSAVSNGGIIEVSLRFIKLRTLRATLRSYFYSIEGNVNNYKDTQECMQHFCVAHRERCCQHHGDDRSPCPSRNEMPSAFIKLNHQHLSHIAVKVNNL